MSTQPEQLRSFCAIEFPVAVRASVMKHIAHLREKFPDVQASWSRETNIHLTLKFLGNVETNRIPNLSAAASSAVKELQPFPISISQAGAFPKSGSPRVLWIGIGDPTGGLAQLQSRLEEECSRKGFSKEQRPFHPHLTVARLRHPKGARELAQAHKDLPFETIEVVVSELVVIRSELSSKGSRYTALARCKMTDDR